MDVPRICKNQGCLYILKANPVVFDETDSQEEKDKKVILDANAKCPKCGSHVTQYGYKMLEFIKNKPDKMAAMGLTTPEAVKIAEAGEKKYKEAQKVTEEAAKKGEEEGKIRAGLKK